METENIVNLLTILTMKIQNLRQKKVCYWQWIKRYLLTRKSPIKFLTSSLESSLCDYSDAYVLVIGNIAVVGTNNNTKVAFKNAHHSEDAEQK